MCVITFYMHLQLHTAPTKIAVPVCLHITMIPTEHIFIRYMMRNCKVEVLAIPKDKLEN